MGDAVAVVLHAAGHHREGSAGTHHKVVVFKDLRFILPHETFAGVVHVRHLQRQILIGESLGGQHRPARQRPQPVGRSDLHLRRSYLRKCAVSPVEIVLPHQLIKIVIPEIGNGLRCR